MTDAERVQALYERVKRLQRKRERRKTASLSVACTGTGLCLMLMIFGGGGAHRGGTAGLFTGATILFEGAGVYVLVALLAFMAGVVITLLCLRRQRHQPRPPGDPQIRPKDRSQDQSKGRSQTHHQEEDTEERQ